jgi:hypothetical protein
VALGLQAALFVVVEIKRWQAGCEPIVRFGNVVAVGNGDVSRLDRLNLVGCIAKGTTVPPIMADVGRK